MRSSSLVLWGLGCGLLMGPYLRDRLVAWRRARGAPHPSQVLEHRVVADEHEFRVLWSDGTSTVCRGSVYGWHYYPSGELCGPALAEWLYPHWRQAEWTRKEDDERRWNEYFGGRAL